jgi:hypothetical protein
VKKKTQYKVIKLKKNQEKKRLNLFIARAIQLMLKGKRA